MRRALLSALVALAGAAVAIPVLALALPNDPLYPTQGYLTQVKASAAWDVTPGNPIRVALMDTGNPCHHIDLVGKCDPGFTATWVQQESEWDESWLGHAVSSGSILAALTDNAEGVAGMARNVRIVPVKVCTRVGRCADYPGEDMDGVVAGLRWIIAQGDIKVVNASIASMPFFPEIQAAVCDARVAGITVVAAAGNNGLTFTLNQDGTYANQPPLYPLASTDCMLVVGGTSLQSTRAPWVDVVAQDMGVQAAACAFDYTRPLGVPCPVTWAGHMWEQYYGSGPVYTSPSGTSFAAPQVAGGVAIIRSLPRAWCNCSADVDYIEATIKGTAQPFECLKQIDPYGTIVPTDGCGAGVPDFGAAVALAAVTPTPTPSPTATATPPCFPPRAQRCR